MKHDSATKMLPPQAEMVRAFMASDAHYEGVFFTAVKTTQIFCRPTCSARKPKPENIEFFASVDDAMMAGYRACLRCKPLQVKDDAPAWIRPVIEMIDAARSTYLSNAQLIERGLDPTRVRRWFKQHYGMTFHQYARSRRLATSLSAIQSGETLDNAAFDHGYESLSGYRDAIRAQFDATPKQAAQQTILWFTQIATPLGTMLAAAEDRGLVMLEFGDRPVLPRELASLNNEHSYLLAPGAHAHLDSIKHELAAYFAGELMEFKTPLHPVGTPFEMQVWQSLLTIPYAQTRSYGEMAKQIGKPKASRALGAANGRNHIAIVIPCHRVIGADGSLTGYGGGQARKAFLLRLEQDALAKRTDLRAVNAAPQASLL